MDPIAVPEAAKRERPECQVVSMGPPRGVSDDDCGTAEMLIAPPETATKGIGRGQYAYFQPSPAELEQLNAGGFIEFAQYGTIVQPFSARVWSAEAQEHPEPERRRSAITGEFVTEEYAEQNPDTTVTEAGD